MADREEVTLDGRPLHLLRVADLKAALGQRGLAKSGQKSVLIERLRGALMLENLQKHSSPQPTFQTNSQKGSSDAVGAKAAPRTPARVLVKITVRTPGSGVSKNEAPQKATKMVAAPCTGFSSCSMAPAAREGPPGPKWSPWALQGQLGQAQGRLQGLENEKRELQSSNQQLRESLKQLQKELGEREQRESSLSARISALELELSKSLAELQQSCSCLQAREAENLRLQAEEEQRRHERDQARGKAQEALQQLEKTEAQLQQAQQQLQQQMQLLAEREEQIHLLEIERRLLHNDIQELRGNIRVFCRVRPLLPEERECQQGLPHLHFPPQEPHSLVLTRPANSQVGRERRTELRYNFSFDRVFPPEASQQDIYQEVQLLVQSALDGYPVCIFAYGQTGSGKTFCMVGPEPPGAPELHGLIPRAARHLFLGARDLAGKGWQYCFSASFLEIYNEELRDLLACGQRSSKLEIRQLAPDTKELYVPNLTWVPVHSEEQVLQLLLQASSQRSVARTRLNERSSRSHSVFQLRIQCQHAARGICCSSSLTLVDLAASERLDKSGSVRNRLRETQSINSSLSALGRVISALRNKEQHIPYRNSKLTFLLQNSLGGHAKVVMIVTISPLEKNFAESLNSLRFATMVNKCVIGTAQAKWK